MRVTDIEVVMRIESVSFPSSWSAVGYRHELTANPNANYVVLETRATETAETEVIGYAGYWHVADEVHISTIAVRPEWRGKGLGALLLTWMIHEAIGREAAVVNLEVRAGNEAAQRLYASYGFVIVGRRRRYYRDTGEDALLMDLDLTPAAVRDMLEARWEALSERLRNRS